MGSGLWLRRWSRLINNQRGCGSRPAPSLSLCTRARHSTRIAVHECEWMLGGDDQRGRMVQIGCHAFVSLPQDYYGYIYSFLGTM